MPMTDREQFKIGFLARCVEEGLTPAQTRERIKAAGVLGDVASGIRNVAMPLGLLGGVALAGAPIALGATAGYAASKMQEDPLILDKARSNEAVAEYLRLADQARRRIALKHALGHTTLASPA